MSPAPGYLGVVVKNFHGHFSVFQKLDASLVQQGRDWPLEVLNGVKLVPLGYTHSNTFLEWNSVIRTSKMVQPVKVLATKSDNLSSILGNQFLLSCPSYLST